MFIGVRRSLSLMRQSHSASLQVQVQFGKDVVSLCVRVHARGVCSGVEKLLSAWREGKTRGKM